MNRFYLQNGRNIFGPLCGVNQDNVTVFLFLTVRQSGFLIVGLRTNQSIIRGRLLHTIIREYLSFDQIENV